MKLIDWDKIGEVARTTPPEDERISQSGAYISMKGVLETTIVPGRELPRILYDIVDQIEAEFIGAFEGEKVVGEHMVNPTNAAGRAYLAQIYVEREAKRIAHIDIKGDRVGNLETMPTFYGFFPLGEFKQRSVQVMRELNDRYVFAYERVMRETIPPGLIPADKIGDHSVVLVRNGNGIAIGQLALDEERIEISLGRTHHITNGGVVV